MAAMILLFIIGILPESGSSHFSEGKFSFCSELARLIYPIFGGVDTNLKYLLFTRSNPQDACDLQPTEEALKKCKFNPKTKTFVPIHGWVNVFGPENPFLSIKDKLLQTGDYNVVVYNWSKYSNTYNYTSTDAINYPAALVNSFFVGLKLSSWIHFLQAYAGADTKLFHLIPQSLGAEVCHFAAMTICNLGRITYLDAAAPFVRLLPGFLQPSSTDAGFVEEIHTNGALTVMEGNGYVRPIADIDYYPNGGQKQPYCSYGAIWQLGTGEYETVTSSSTEKSCNHDLVLTYYIASFNKTCKFLGRICDSYENFTNGKCSRSPVCRMGFYSKLLPDLPAHSKCYLKTSAKPPFCQ